MPKTSMVSATWPRLSPLAASTEAAPSVGPTQGLQTAPSSRPSANWPDMPAVEKPPRRFSTQLPAGPPAAARRIETCGTSSTTPISIISTAAAIRKTSPFSPIEKPIVAMNMPIARKDSASPAARARGP